MKKTIILNAIGKDRPGIVAAVSKVLFETGCNIEDSSMTRLGNDFAMILMISLSDQITLSLLAEKLSAAGKKTGLSLSWRELTASELKAPKNAKAAPYMISVYGGDKPGIVYKISNFLAAKKINITDVETKIISSQTSPIYVMILEVHIPEQINVAHLTTDLTNLARELNIDININPIESYQL